MLSDLWLRLRSLFRRRAEESALDDELRFHFDQHVEKLIRSGLSLAEARRHARLLLGGSDQIKEEYRDSSGVRFLETLWQDLRFGLRMLRKSPGFTAVAVLTLALGIGANTAIFSFVNAMVIRPLPVERPSELAFLVPTDRQSGSLGFSYPLFEAVRDQNRTLAGVFVTARGLMNVSVDGQAELAPGGGQYVSSSYFSTLGVEAIFGRTFTAAEDKVPGQNPVAVISYGYWRRRFALSPSTVGKTIYLNGIPFTIIGVTGPRFFGIVVGHPPDITVPMTMYPLLNPGGMALNDPDSWWLTPMARLKPGISTEQTTADLSAILEHYLEAQGPATGFKAKSLSMRLEPGAWGLSIRSKGLRFATLLMTLVGLVLLIACTNVANLLLARGAARQKEIAVRVSIGAGRGRLIRQLVTESLLLALMGGVMGFLFASWGAQGLLKLAPQQVSSVNLSPDIHVFVFTGVTALLAGLLFGLVPAWRVTRISLVQGLQGGVRQGANDSHRNRLGNGLVVSQVMLSTALLFLAGLFTRSLQELLSVDLGFRPERVVMFSLDPSLVGYQGSRLVGLYKNLLVHAEAVPGVTSASLSRGGLVSHESWGGGVYVPGYVPQPGEFMESRFNPVGPNFFQTAGIPILLGRDFRNQDNENAPKVAIVNETFARHFFGQQNGVQRALGQMLGLGINQTSTGLPHGWQNLGQFEIVGVAKDSKQRTLSESPVSVVYFPFWQADLPPSLIGQMTLEVRSAGEPRGTTKAVRQELLAVEKNLPISGVKTLTEQVQESLEGERFFARLVSSFGLLALLLASVGLYGLIAYSTVRRTSEIGIRVALGAHQSEVFALVIGGTLRLTALGVVIGMALAIAAGHAVSSMLYGVSAADPLTILGASLLMFGAATLAGFLPARRAMRVDPMVALRYE